MEREPNTGGVIEPLVPEKRAPSGPYRSPARLSSVVIALLTVHVVFDAAAAIADWQMLDLLQRVRDGAAVTFEEASAHDDRVFYAGLLQFAGVILAGIPFLMWFRRVYRNLGPLGVQMLRFKPGWAVGGWFVPFLGLARPKSIANDVWRASNPELPRDLVEPPEGAPVPGVMNWWWGTFLVGWWLYPVDTGGDLNPSLDELMTQVQRALAADAFLVVAGILAILVVRKITLRQEQRHATLASQGSPAPAA